jgi:hypothetical protein
MKTLFAEADIAQGKYSIKFYKEGQWKRITIDDQLPCTKDMKPAYGHGKTSFWKMMIMVS